MLPRFSRSSALRALVLAGLLSVLVPAASALGNQAPPQPFADLTRLAPDVFVWRYQGYVTMFIVTDEGVIAADPIGQTNRREPELFKAVIRSVTDQPVVYLIYSHGNSDHSLGADVFADTATLIATQAAADKLAALDSPRHPAPTLIVDDYLHLELGGKAIDLYWPGETNASDHLIVHYPDRGVLFAVDFLPVRSLPVRDFSEATSIDRWVDSLKWIEESLDFDVLVPGHGELGSKETVRELREYFGDLVQTIAVARARGLEDNSREMVAFVGREIADKYARWANFEAYLPLNIAGALRIIWGV